MTTERSEYRTSQSPERVRRRTSDSSPGSEWRAAYDAKGTVGDEVSVASNRVRGGQRHGRIEAVLGTPEHRYYRVRWDDGRESVFHPGADARVRAHDSSTASPRPRRPPSHRGSAQPLGSNGREEAPSRPPERLRAAPGDRLVIGGHRLGEPDRDGEVLETADGGLPPFRIRWSDTGRVALLFPGPDARVEHYPRRRRAQR